MPIVDPTPQSPPAEQPSPVRIATPQYKGVTVDTRYIPSTALLTNIEGSSWTVNYYSQVLDQDSAVQGQVVTRDAIYQQYRLIKGFEFKVSAALTSSQDEATKTMALRGSANIYPFLVPNVGDMFLADIGDGREGLFKITMSERKAIFKDTCYSVEYEMIDYSTAERRGDLNSKVILTLQFVKDFLMYGQNPLLTEEEVEIIKQLQDRYYDMIKLYFRSFTSHEFKTLIVPGQEFSVYDHFATKAITSIFNTRDAKELTQIRRLNVDGDPAIKTSTLWDCLLNKDYKLLKHSAWRMGLVSARTWERNPMFESIYYSGIPYVLYPKDPEVSVDYETTKVRKVVSDANLKDVPARMHTLADLLSATQLNGLPYTGAPLIHNVAKDDHYIFTKAFYENAEEGQSKLELAVRDYLENKALSNKLLLAFCDTCHAWGSLERFYFIPIVLILIKASIRSL